MKNVSKYEAATPERVWAAFEETDRLLKESRAEFDKEMKESRAEFEKRSKDFDRRMEESRVDFDKRMRKFEEMNGGLSNNQGMFAEEYFYNSFENGRQNFFGEKFDDIEKRVKGVQAGFKDEYDIVLFNGKTIAIVEVKFRARDKDVAKVLKKAKTFRINFPMFQNHQVYLGLAAMTYNDGIEKECKEQGIAIVKQVGDTVVIHDAHLRVF